MAGCCSVFATVLTVARRPRLAGRDAGLIDGVLVNGSARLMGTLSARVRLWQSGYLFQYAFAMIVGLIGMVAIWVMLK